jgi:hypothetical protein
VRKSAADTNNRNQRQDSARSPETEIVVSSARPAALSPKESVFLPAMSMEVALARRAAIVEFTRRLMVKESSRSGVKLQQNRRGVRGSGRSGDWVLSLHREKGRGEDCPCLDGFLRDSKWMKNST